MMYYENFAKLAAWIDAATHNKSDRTIDGLENIYNTCLMMEDIDDLCERHPEYKELMSKARKITGQ